MFVTQKGLIQQLTSPACSSQSWINKWEIECNVVLVGTDNLQEDKLVVVECLWVPGVELIHVGIYQFKNIASVHEC